MGTHRHDEGISKASSRVCQMLWELDPVVVKPTAWNDGEAVETSYAGLSEQGGEDVTNNTANGMGSKDLE